MGGNRPKVSAVISSCFASQQTVHLAYESEGPTALDGLMKFTVPIQDEAYCLASQCCIPRIGGAMPGIEMELRRIANKVYDSK